MGTTGQIAIGARGVLAYAEETDWGQPIPPNFRVDFKTESFNNEIGNLLSEALNPSRGTSKRVPGTSNITGDVAVEQNTEGYGTWYKHALGAYVTLAGTDGGLRAQVSEDYSTTGSNTTLKVTGDITSTFEATGGNYGLKVVYKDADGDLQASSEDLYAGLSFSAGETTITLAADLGVDVQQGAWVFQSNTTDWTGVYTHYIEAAPTLPVGLTFEVGRDLAYFIYSGVKMNTVEETYTAQEILQATFGTIGRAEYSGADLLVAATAASTELSLDNFHLDYYSASQNIGYAFSDDGTVFTDETADANNNTADDVTLLPVTPAVSDAFYFGADDVFPALEIIISTAAVTPNWTITWEYSQGSSTWATLSFNNQETVDLDEAAGTYVNSFDIPSDWATDTVNAQSAYWVRARVSAYTAGTGPIGQRIYLGPGIIGFNKVGEVQVGSENEIAYDGTEVSISAGTAKLKNITNWASDSDHAVGEPVAVQVHWDDPADPPVTDPLSSFQAAVYLDGVSQEVLSGSWTLNNNMFTDKFQLGDRFRAGLPEQLRTVEGVLNVEFDDEILYHKYINADSAYLEFRSVDDGGGTISSAGNDVYRQKHVLFPNIEFTGTTPQIGGPDQITHDMNFVALVDEENSMNEVAIILVNTVATI